MKSPVIIEVAAFTAISALQAARGRADRIELCSGFSEGGLSPSAGIIRFVREKVQVPVHVMIRPRVGDFIYGVDEIHLSGKVRVRSAMNRKHVAFSLALPGEVSDEYWYECDPRKIIQIRKIIQTVY